MWMFRMKTQQIIAIAFHRLPRVDDLPGLVSLTIDATNGAEPGKTIGTLTDVALRGRLAHWDNHSAIEVASIRRALVPDYGQATVHEGWSDMGSCVRFWHDFAGSTIRPLEWSCTRCSALHREQVGASVGETLSRRCQCGTITRVTIATHVPRLT
jgi:hypothetical protein